MPPERRGCNCAVRLEALSGTSGKREGVNEKGWFADTNRRVNGSFTLVGGCVAGKQ